MEKNTRADSQKIPSKFGPFLAVLVLTFSVWAANYTDQIAIEMPNATKTVYDIRVHSFIRNLYENGTVIDPTGKDWLASSFESERESYIHQFLAQSYVVENALDIKPSKDEVKNAAKRIDNVFKNADAKKKALALLDLSDSEIGQWINNRLILEKFAATLLLDRVVVTEQKLTEYYQTWKLTKFSNRPYSEVQQRVKDDLTRSLLQEEFKKWVDEEKRRRKMTLKKLME